MNKKLTLVTFIAMLGIFLLGTFNVPAIATESSTNSASTLPPEIKLCGVFPISQRPDAGPDRRDAFLMAIDDINAQTGSSRILPAGVNLTGIVKDDLNTAAGGTAAAQSCVSDGANLVIGSSGSTVSAAMASVLTPLKIIQISYASTSPTLSNRTAYPYFMRNVPSDADQGMALADLIQAFGFTKGAVIHTSDSYGNGLISFFKPDYTNLSSANTIVTDQNFEAGATDVSAQVQAIADANPQFVLVHAIDNDAKTVFKKAYDLGIAGSGSNISWVITDGSASTATFAGDKNVKSAMQHVIGTSPTAFTGATFKAFNNSWFSVTSCGTVNPCAAARTHSVPNSYAPFAYDSVFVAAHGFADAGTVTNSTALLNALYKVKFTGAGGDVAFNSLGEVDGHFDYLTLVGDAYQTFGTWHVTSSFTQSTVTLPNNEVWTLSSNAYGYSGNAGGSTPGFEFVALLLGVGTLVLIRRRK